ncbi:magnesium transporter CorA family protein [Paenibacillus sp. LHD-38]|uniref:magnesium transporter CorA family protein n=1 Tax=Paenibacillus sp. LHD-38 TaxID=3072143 RepID=UPI00280EF724|nr:magnesium transporter CorA family protein [Paenibacillus sp. LHD-38]MDQ8738494.1 magnesium transporter CorA family protein [Paenibacillus sp. LHD-38]
MIHRMLRYPAGWEWHVLQQARQQPPRNEPLPSRKDAQKHTNASREEQRAVKAITRKEQDAAEQHTDELKHLFPECASWIDECSGRRTNMISVGDASHSKKLLFGTLMFQITDDQADVQPFHFWLTEDRLLTMHEDMRLPLRLQSAQHTSKLDSCATAPEAFFIMLSIVLDTFHAGLDGFETRLGELETTMRQENRTGLIDIIFERRYELLHWSHLFIPIREVHSAAKEAFMNDLTDVDSFQRITHKLERIDALLKHYALEIDTLISMDDAISNFRGNDIMKTLTIFTVLFLPATIIGSIWGVNFEILPFKDYKWSFAAMIAVISIITLFMYIWLWKKGWTGDLLNGRTPNEIIAPDGSSARGKRSDRMKASRSERTSTAAASTPPPQAKTRSGRKKN